MDAITAPSVTALPQAGSLEFAVVEKEKAKNNAQVQEKRITGGA